MHVNEKTSEVLNDLIRINNDRIAGYDHAEKESDNEDTDLQSVFKERGAESQGYVNELSRLVSHSGEETTDGTTLGGKIYRAWMDVKATFTGRDRKSILASCEHGEDAAQNAYESALASDAEMPADIRQVIMDQKMGLKKSHDSIKSLRDRQHA